MLYFAVFAVMNDSLLLKQTEDAKLFSFLKKVDFVEEYTVQLKRHDRFQASATFGCSKKRQSSLGR